MFFRRHLGITGDGEKEWNVTVPVEHVTLQSVLGYHLVNETVEQVHIFLTHIKYGKTLEHGTIQQSRQCDGW
jgi:hypothetical protein